MMNGLDTDKTPLLKLKSKFSEMEESPMCMLFNDRYTAQGQGQNTQKSNISLYNEWDKYQTFADMTSGIGLSPTRNQCSLPNDRLNAFIDAVPQGARRAADSIWKF